MKKFLIAFALGLVLVLAIASVASADNGPHGSFSATTAACASCHRAHTAKATTGEGSLLIMAPDLLCLSCHDGTGAGTNVVDGVYTETGHDAAWGAAGSEGLDGRSLFGGGFTNALMATAWSGATTANAAFDAASRGTTSAHTYDGTPGTLWGAGAGAAFNASYPNGNGVTNFDLECVSCHDPHGNAGWLVDGATANATTNTGTLDTKIRTYRLLRFRPSGSDGFTDPTIAVSNWTGGAFPTSDMGTASATDNITGWTVPDNYATNGTEWYTIGTVSAFAVGDYNAGNANNVYQPHGQGGVTQSYVNSAVNVAFFCAQCHDRYFVNSNLRNTHDSITSAYCRMNGAVGIANPTYTTNPANVPGASATNPMLFPATQTHPSKPECIAQVSYSTRYTGYAGLTAAEAAAAAPLAAGYGADTAAFIRASWGDDRPTEDDTYVYGHSTGDIRVPEDGAGAAGTGTTLSRSCVACHVAHGTASLMQTVAQNGTIGYDDVSVADDYSLYTGANPEDIVYGGSLAGGSTLLRMDNRSICLRCHASAVGFTVAP